MDLYENEELCTMIDNYFDENDFIYKKSNTVQNINIDKYNFSVFQDSPSQNEQIKPFFLLQTMRASSLLQSSEKNSKESKNINSKVDYKTQTNAEMGFDFSELDKLFQIEVDKCSNKDNQNQIKKDSSE